MEGKTHRTILAAAVAGLLSAVGAASAQAADPHGRGGSGETVPCYGVNKCKGTGACGGKGTSCAGTNACKGQGFLQIDKETCLKIDGGRLTPEPEAS
jgi:uncharacterized membrane protein